MQKQKSTLVFKNAAIYTVNKNLSWAQALAIAKDKIIFVGTNEEVAPYIASDTTVIDLDRKMVLPGFIDAHAHPSHTMDVVGNISLFSLGSIDEYVETIAKFTESYPSQDFYRGSGWADTLFSDLGPTREALDAIMPDRPMALVSYDGHSLWVNSETLKRAGITKDTPNPAGGRIERDPKTGQPSGTLRETARNLVAGVIPDYSLEERKNALLAYQEMAARAGITMSHDAMLDSQSIAAFKELEEEERLKMRFRGSITIEPDGDLEEQIQNLLEEGDRNSHPYFQINAAKLFVDGVVEGGTAYLLEPYAHKPDFRGEPVWKSKPLHKACAAIDREKLQFHAHVIGDAAARITLDALEHAQNTNGKRDSRPLVTHLQLVAPEDIPRFKELDVVGLPQPFWFKIDEYYHELALPYLGKERADRQYPMQSFLDAGVVIASASDFPVTIPFDPLIAIQTGITRSTNEGEVLWPEEQVSLADMLRSFTYNGAYANFLENTTGSLEIGKQADLIVLDQNLFEVPTNEIAKTKVLLTMVDGEEIFRDSTFRKVIVHSLM